MRLHTTSFANYYLLVQKVKMTLWQMGHVIVWSQRLFKWNTMVFRALTRSTHASSTQDPIACLLPLMYCLFRAMHISCMQLPGNTHRLHEPSIIESLEALQHPSHFKNSLNINTAPSFYHQHALPCYACAFFVRPTDMRTNAQNTASIAFQCSQHTSSLQCALPTAMPWTARPCAAGIASRRSQEAAARVPPQSMAAHAVPAVCLHAPSDQMPLAAKVHVRANPKLALKGAMGCALTASAA